MVLRAAVMKLKVAWMAEGNMERACISVEYEAIMIGGKGGKSVAWVGEGCSTGCDGW